MWKYTIVGGLDAAPVSREANCSCGDSTTPAGLFALGVSVLGRFDQLQRLIGCHLCPAGCLWSGILFPRGHPSACECESSAPILLIIIHTNLLKKAHGLYMPSCPFTKECIHARYSQADARLLQALAFHLFSDLLYSSINL